MTLGFLLIFNIITSWAFPAKQPENYHTVFSSRQIIIVQTNDWNSIQGRLSMYSWIDNKWKASETDIPVVVGRSGLAWGDGLLKTAGFSGKRKREGDGNSPAGIYRIKGLFGYKNNTDRNIQFKKVTTNTFCVDDPESDHYNQIVSTNQVKKDWSSAEIMRMKSDAYKLGVFVGYNTDPVISGNGSCIFLHLWSGAKSPTSGCTAMSETDMIKVFKFLKDWNPTIIQLPTAEYQKLKTQFILP